MNGRRVKISTGETIHPDNWNKAKQLPRSNAPSAATLTTYLERLKSRAREVHLSLKADFANITPNVLKTAIERDIKNGGKKETFVQFIERFIVECAEYRPEGSIEVYRSILKLLKGYNGPKDFGDINDEWFKKYQAYLERTKMADGTIGAGINYIGKNVGVIRELMTVAKDQGLHRNTDYKGGAYTKPREDAFTIYLTVHELLKMYVINLPKKQSIVRDRNMIAAFTALRFSDSSKITPNSVRDGLMWDKNQKTGEDVVVPLHWVVKQILEDNPDGLPPAPSNQSTNKALKAIAKKAGITDNVQVTKTKGGKLVTTVVNKYELVSSHTMRRSAASNMLKAGIPQKAIMMVGGWKTDESFRKYIRIGKEENALMIQDHSYFQEG